MCWATSCVNNILWLHRLLLLQMLQLLLVHDQLLRLLLLLLRMLMLLREWDRCPGVILLLHWCLLLLCIRRHTCRLMPLLLLLSWHSAIRHCSCDGVGYAV